MSATSDNPHVGSFHRVRCVRCTAIFIALHAFSRCSCGYLNDVRKAKDLYA